MLGFKSFIATLRAIFLITRFHYSPNEQFMFIFSVGCSMRIGLLQSPVEEWRDAVTVILKVIAPPVRLLQDRFVSEIPGTYSRMFTGMRLA